MIKYTQLKEKLADLLPQLFQTLSDTTVEKLREAMIKKNIEREAVWSTRIHLPFFLCPSKVPEFNEFCDKVELQIYKGRMAEYIMGLAQKRVSELHQSLRKCLNDAREVLRSLNRRWSWNENNKAVIKYLRLVKRCRVLIEKCEKVNTREKASYDSYIGYLEFASARIERDFCPFLYAGYAKPF